MRQPIWQKAASFAARMHKKECRDDDETPYFSHPARVALTVAHVFGCEDEDALAAALLHDVMENTDEGYDSLEAEFGADIADLVVALTKNMMLPSKERETDYEDRLRKANWRARLIKLADEFDNLADTLTGMKEGDGTEHKKARRMIALAETDAEKHSETKHAIAALNRLIEAKRLR